MPLGTNPPASAATTATTSAPNFRAIFCAYARRGPAAEIHIEVHHYGLKNHIRAPEAKFSCTTHDSFCSGQRTTKRTVRWRLRLRDHLDTSTVPGIFFTRICWGQNAPSASWLGAAPKLTIGFRSLDFGCISIQGPTINPLQSLELYLCSTERSLTATCRPNFDSALRALELMSIRVD